MTKLIGDFPSEAQAELARILLEEHGIRAEIAGGLSPYEGLPTAFNGVRLVVADRDRALRVLAGEEPEPPDQAGA